MWARAPALVRERPAACPAEQSSAIVARQGLSSCARPDTRGRLSLRGSVPLPHERGRSRLHWIFCRTFKEKLNAEVL